MDKSILKSKWDSLNPLLDERARRIWAATEAVAIGRSGISLVAEATGLSRTTIHAGIKELRDVQEGKVPAVLEGDRLRAAGSGRKRLAAKDPTLIADLELLVDPATKGDPMSPLRWTSKSTNHLAKALQQRGHKISARTVAAMLIDQGYSLQANRKSKESENVGNDHDTPEFAVNSIRTWWEQMGRPMYPKATRLMVTADCGGSNSYRSRAWKLHLQKLADDMRLEISVCHFPPGTSKWNKIEHRMFCHITQNWRGRPLVSLEVVVNLIGTVTTRKGLKIRASLDPRKYETGTKVTDHELARVQLRKSDFQGAWNYAILPRSID